MTDTVVLVPMLGRAHLIGRLAVSIRETSDAAILWLTTPGDAEVADALDSDGEWRIEVDNHPLGDYARKINTGIKATDHPLIFTGAIDLVFRPDWLEAALAELRPGIGVVGTVDRCNRRTMRGEHATHMLVTRRYVEDFGTIDEPGKFFHEGYPHELVDDEAVATAKHRHAWAFARGSVVEHWHPMNGRAPMDESYAKQAQRIAAGWPTFEKRRPLWT